MDSKKMQREAERVIARRPSDVHSLSSALVGGAELWQRGAFSLDEFSAWSGICKTNVWGAIREGRLKARRITKRRIIILPHDATEFMNSLPVVNLAEAA